MNSKDKAFEYVKTIEQMTEAQISQRIKEAMEIELPNKLRVVDYHGGVEQIVEYKYQELVAHCPMTFILDTYEIILRFIPKKKIPELKSLKMYYWNYQDMPISHEHLAARIYKDFLEAVKPLKFYLQLNVAGRGGIFTTVQIGNKDLDTLAPRESSNL